MSAVSTDGSAGPDSALFEWAALLISLMQTTSMGGIDPKANDKLGQHLKEQGFVNIMELVYEWPVGE